MFYRKKNINGKTYWYLVENKRIQGKVKQRVIAYIGNDKKLKQHQEENK